MEHELGMRIRVRLFAAYREAVGRGEMNLEVEGTVSPLHLWRRLGEEHPPLLEFGHSTLVAVNGEYAPLDWPLKEGDEVAFIPPVSGGSFRVTDEEIRLPELIDEVRGEEVGAIVTFLGTVRQHSRGREVQHLEYEAYPEMAERKLEEIGREMQERWGVRAAIVQRVGHLEVGEASAAIAVAAPHRREAFEATRYAIDRLKEMVPIWKKEFHEGGEEWIG